MPHFSGFLLVGVCLIAVLGGGIGYVMKLYDIEAQADLAVAEAAVSYLATDGASCFGIMMGRTFSGAVPPVPSCASCRHCYTRFYACPAPQPCGPWPEYLHQPVSFLTSRLSPRRLRYAPSFPAPPSRPTTSCGRQ